MPGVFVPIIGGPAWIDSDLYQIEAKAAGPASYEMLRGPMLQALLEDRFKLKVSRETRDVPVYEVTIARDGLKLPTEKDGNCVPLDRDSPPPELSPGKRPVLICGLLQVSQRALDARGITLSAFFKLLSGRIDRPIIDKTETSGTFDIHLDWSIEVPARTSTSQISEGPASSVARDSASVIADALPAALRRVGLRIKSAKGPGDSLVIDHVERPTEN